MKEKELKNLLTNAKSVEKNSDLEYEAFELILEICKDKGYTINNFFENQEEYSLCDQQKFVYLVALENDEILDIFYDFHKTFGETEFCKNDFKNKFKLHILENTFEIAI